MSLSNIIFMPLRMYFYACRGLGGVIIWMEIRFDAGIVENYVGIEDVINNTTFEDNFTMVGPDLIEFERIR